MARRFIVVPAGTFTDTTDWESASLELEELPNSLYLDFDPAQPATITKDGSNYVSSWRNMLGSEVLNTAASGSNFPQWVDATLNGKPIIDCNNGGLRSIYSGADVLHNLSLGYSFALVCEIYPASTVFWASSVAGAGFTSMYQQADRTWRNNGTEAISVGTGLLASGFRILIGTFNPTGFVLNMYQDGTKLGGYTSAGLPGTGRKLSLGWNSVFTGRIRYARAMFFNATLSDAEAATTYRILKNEYAL